MEIGGRGEKKGVMAARQRRKRRSEVEATKGRISIRRKERDYCALNINYCV